MLLINRGGGGDERSHLESQGEGTEGYESTGSSLMEGEATSVAVIQLELEVTSSTHDCYGQSLLQQATTSE